MTRSRTLRALLLSVGLIVVLVASNAAAQSPSFSGTTVLNINHTFDRVIQSIDRQQYNLSLLPTVRTQFLNIAGTRYNAEQLQQWIGQHIAQNPSTNYLIVYSGHGETNGPGIDGVPFTRLELAQMTQRALAEQGARGTLVFDDCGSGNLCRIPGICDAQNCPTIIASSLPGQIGVAPDLGERFQDVLRNFDRYDTNRDGILTAGEVWQALRPGSGAIQSADANTPMFFRDAETAERNRTGNADLCVVVPPGQDPAYGPMYPPESSESTLNQVLRLHNATFLTRNTAAATKAASGRVRGTVIPDMGQAWEFVDSGFRYYSVNGVAVSPGAYPVGRPQQVQATGRWVRADEKCEFREVQAPTAPSPGRLPTPPPDPNQLLPPGGGQQTAQNPLFALLPALLQSLFQRQQPQQSAPPPRPPPDSRVPSGAVNQLQPNLPPAPPSPASFVGNVGTVFQQLAQSGAPNSLFEDMARVVTALVLSFLRGGLTVGETVVQ